MRLTWPLTLLELQGRVGPAVTAPSSARVAEAKDWREGSPDEAAAVTHCPSAQLRRRVIMTAKAVTGAVRDASSGRLGRAWPTAWIRPAPDGSADAPNARKSAGQACGTSTTSATTAHLALLTC
jgi:hypothetical protein